MSEERLNEIKNSVNFQRKLLLAHNMNTLCVDEEQELIEEINRLNNIINEAIEYIGTNIPARALEQLYTNYELGESLLFVKTAEDLLKILNKGDSNE